MKSFVLEALSFIFCLTVSSALFPQVVVAQHGHHHNQHQHQASTPPDLSELEALYWERQDASRQFFVQADVDFMTDMIIHHAQALIMSRLSPVNGASPAVQRLSARIINAQQDEIALMQQWLRDRGQAVPIIEFDGLYMHVSMEEPMASSRGHQHDSHTHHQSGHAHHDSTHADESEHVHHDSARTDHSEHTHDRHAQIEDHSAHGHHGHNHHAHHGHHDHEDMPGMLTQAQLYELGAASDSEFDRLFLTYMIEHHEGAVYMVNELFMADGAGTDQESYRLAVDIYAEQVTEIAMMRKMLERKGFPVPEPIIELQEQQERLRNPGTAPDHNPHYHHHHNSHESPANGQSEAGLHEVRHRH